MSVVISSKTYKAIIVAWRKRYMSMVRKHDELARSKYRLVAKYLNIPQHIRARYNGDAKP